MIGWFVRIDTLKYIFNNIMTQRSKTYAFVIGIYASMSGVWTQKYKNMGQVKKKNIILGITTFLPYQMHHIMNMC